MYIKKFNESQEFPDGVGDLRSYIVEFCEDNNLEFVENEDFDYRNIGDHYNGYLLCNFFSDSIRIERLHKIFIRVVIRDYYLLGNNKKFNSSLTWLMDRIGELSIQYNNIGIRFYDMNDTIMRSRNPTRFTKTQYDYTFDIIKKVN